MTRNVLGTVGDGLNVAVEEVQGMTMVDNDGILEGPADDAEDVRELQQ